MSECKKKLTDVGLLWLRLTVGATIAWVGYGKVFGGQIAMLQEGLVKMGLPLPGLLAWLAALSEFAGGILIVLGLGTRVASFFLFITMCVAFFVAHAADPFHVKMPAYLYGVVALTLVLTGAGRYALDSLVCRGKCKSSEEK